MKLKKIKNVLTKFKNETNVETTSLTDNKTEQEKLQKKYFHSFPGILKPIAINGF